MASLDSSRDDLVSSVPPLRVRLVNAQPVRVDGRYVLYWMTAYRRAQSNFALQRAAEWARHLRLPLVVLSALRLDYPNASERTHSFILDSMADVDHDLAGSAVTVHSYVEPHPGAGRGLLGAMAADAAVVVADDAPVFFLPAMLSKSAAELSVLVEAVDHNSLVPLADTDRAFLRAYDLRRHHQRELHRHLDESPDVLSLSDLPKPDADLLASIEREWPGVVPDRKLVASLPFRYDVPRTERHGGSRAASTQLADFVANRLGGYGDRNHPDSDTASGLSPHLHFGTVSAHQVFDAVADYEQWTPGSLAGWATGARHGWWGMSAAAEAFLDQVLTWRELGYRAARVVPHNNRYRALPGWAQATLAEHAADTRDHLYGIEQLDAAETHDDLWNAAQLQLRHEGSIHNYLRMLWGKKILEWTADPEQAHDIMFELNDRYALDGRDPNSVSGIHWVLGRYDRPWGPERPVFGKVRYMSSQSTRRKLRLSGYQSKMLNT